MVARHRETLHIPRRLRRHHIDRVGIAPPTVQAAELRIHVRREVDIVVLAVARRAERRRGVLEEPLPRPRRHVELEEARFVHRDVVRDKHAGFVLRPVLDAPTHPFALLQNQPPAAQVLGVQIPVDAVAGGGGIAEPSAARRPGRAHVARLAVAQARGRAARFVAPEQLVELRTAFVLEEREAVALGIRMHGRAAHGFVEEGDLAAHSHWLRHPMQLRGVAEARGDQHAVAQPAEQLRRARVLVALQRFMHVRGDLRHALHHQCAAWRCGRWRSWAAGPNRCAGGHHDGQNAQGDSHGCSLSKILMS